MLTVKLVFLKCPKCFKRVNVCGVVLLAGASQPVWVEVLMELLLSLLSRPSHLMRSVVNSIFLVLCPHLTTSAVQLIIPPKTPKPQNPFCI